MISEVAPAIIMIQNLLLAIGMKWIVASPSANENSRPNISEASHENESRW
jgi:hypothetical protein